VAGGVVVAGGAIAIASSNKGGSSKTNTPVPSSTPTATPTATPTPLFTFIEADATWSGDGDVDVQILDPTGTPVGVTTPAGCESTTQRTERVLLQGVLAPGTYKVMLTGKTCDAATPATIAVALSVQSESGTKCPTSFLNVPVGSTIQGCQFILP
jgi:hypothetical protein